MPRYQLIHLEPYSVWSTVFIRTSCLQDPRRAPPPASTPTPSSSELLVLTLVTTSCYIISIDYSFSDVKYFVKKVNYFVV